MLARAEHAERAAHEGSDRLRCLVLVADADAAPDIDMAQPHAGVFQAIYQFDQALCGGHIRGRLVQQ